MDSNISKNNNKSKKGSKNNERDSREGSIESSDYQLPQSFGKKEEKVEINFNQNKRTDKEIKETNIPTKKIESSDDSDSSSEEDEDDLQLDIAELPITHEATLMGHEGAVSALSLDRSGTRLISGSYDSNIKLYDFSGMDTTQRSFKTFEPVEGHHIHDLKHSLSGDLFLAVTSCNQVRLFTREGEEKGVYVKGDPYIFDLRKTNGHVANLTMVGWHPFEKDTFFTACRDGSIRIWDVNTRHKSKDTILLNGRGSGNRPAITAADYSFDGKLIAGASIDGAINIWPANGPYIRTSHSVNNAHQIAADTSSICFSKNSYHLASRGGDDTVKLWDIRSFKSPLKVAENLPNYNSETSLIFSPDEKFLLTGTGAGSEDSYGELIFLDKTNLEPVKRTSITKSSVIKVLWHPGINQIVTGSGDGSIHVLFDPNRSIKGAKLFLSRQPRKKDISDMDMMGPILTLYDEEPEHPNASKNRLRKDPIATRRPDLPSTAPGKGIKVGTNYTNQMMKHLIKDTTRDEDPREALLKYAKEAEENPQFVGQAYSKTQPKPIFDERKDEIDEIREVKRKK